MQTGRFFRRAIPRTLAVNWLNDIEWPRRVAFSGYVGYDTLLIFINPPDVSDKNTWNGSEQVHWAWSYTHPLGIIFLDLFAGASLVDASNRMRIEIVGPQLGDHFSWSGEYPEGVGDWSSLLTPDTEAVNIHFTGLGRYDGPLTGCIIQPVTYHEEP